jgi:hypothetical protein
VRELVLLLTDVYLPPDTDAVVATRVGHARYRAAEMLVSGWRDWLARQLGRNELSGWPVAALVAAAQPTRLGALPATAPEFRADVLLATPLHLIAGLDHVRLPADGLLQLSPEELDGIATSFDAALGSERGLSMRAVPGGGLLLFGMPIGQVMTEDPARWLGADVREALPRGGDANRVRALAAEIEMWLHDHPVNLLRQRRGAPVISALWLWGGGPAQRAAAPQLGRGRAERDLHLAVLTSDPAALALARLARLEQTPAATPAAAPMTAAAELLAHSELRGIAVLALSDYGRRGLAAFEQDWLLPARAALRRGELDALRIMANDRVVTLMRYDALKLWRPSRHWLRALS